jgi:hypothetical protein
LEAKINYGQRSPKVRILPDFEDPCHGLTLLVGLVAKIWVPQIIIEHAPQFDQLMVAHIGDEHGSYLMRYNSEPQETHRLVMKRLIEQHQRKHEEVAKATPSLGTSGI